MFLAASVIVSSCTGPGDAPAIGGDCDNAELTNYSELLILAPHPDDEVLGFAGLASEFRQQGKPVRTVIVTDGDANCRACTLWTTGRSNGDTCNAKDLSNFATSEIDSLAETRRIESINASKILNMPTPEFLGYPDTGIASARTFWEEGVPDRLLQRSDFSSCDSCGDCSSGYGSGPTTELSAETLQHSIDVLLAETSARSLIATTHWLDGHRDHAALGKFVRERIQDLGEQRTVAFAVIHANTKKGLRSSNCWYPGPAAVDCACFDDRRADQDDGWLLSMREHRERQDLRQLLPDDVDYGAASQLCLDETVRANKPRAIDTFETQLGTVGRSPGLLPESRKGLLDCTAYLRSFARTTEVFVVKQVPE